MDYGSRVHFFQSKNKKGGGDLSKSITPVHSPATAPSPATPPAAVFQVWLTFLTVSLRPGDWVVAMGCPLSLQNTITAGIVKTQGLQLLLPVAALHGAAFFIGYAISKLTFGESTSRTISIECGMQSSALGFLLAQKHFTNPLVAVPSTVSVVCMALGGSALAVYWRNQPIPVDDKDDFKE